MKHGKKQQEVCQSKKNKKSIISLRTMLLILTAGILVAVALMITTKVNDITKTTSVYHIITQKQFIFIHNIKDTETYGEDFGDTFDLKNKEYFGFDMAIKGNKVYGVTGTSSKEIYTDTLSQVFTSELMNFKTSKEEIKKNNYQVVKKLVELLNKSNHKSTKKTRKTNFEYIQEDKDYQFDAVRFTFNKDYLPVKLEWHYRPQTDKLTGETYPLA